MNKTKNNEFKKRKEAFQSMIFDEIENYYENLAIELGLEAEVKKTAELEVIQSIQFVDVTESELLELTRFLEDNITIKWGVDILPTVALSGYFKEEPFIVYLMPNKDNDGIIVFRNRIAKFTEGNISYQETIYDSYGKTSMEKKNSVGKFDRKITGITTDFNGGILSYYEETYNNSTDFNGNVFTSSEVPYNANMRTEVIIDDKKLTAVINNLSRNNLINIAEMDTKKDNGYNSFHIVKTYYSIDPAKDETEKVILHMLYPSSHSYLEGRAPKAVRLYKNGKGVTERNFILMNNGYYVDVEVYNEKGLYDSILCVRALEKELEQERLSLELLPELKEWIETGSIPSKVISAIIEKNNSRTDVISRTLKPKQD